MQWILFCCTLARSLCNGFIATACADDCIRMFREVSTHMYILTPLYNAHHHLVKVSYTCNFVRDVNFRDFIVILSIKFPSSNLAFIRIHPKGTIQINH